MGDESTKPEFPSKIEFTPEQYRQLQKAAALRGMTVEEWAIASLNEYADEQRDIEAHRRRHGLRVFRPEEEIH